MTVTISAISMVIALALGTAVAAVRAVDAAPLRLRGGRITRATLATALWSTALSPLQLLAAAYVEFFRNTPVLIQIYFYYFGLPKVGIRLEAFQVGIIAMTVYHATYVSEIVRSGIRAINQGQIEAARSLGLTYPQAMRYVVLPQALRIVIPPLGTLLIALVKNTSLLAAISLGELLFVATLLESRTFRTFEIFTVLIGFYLSLTLPLSFFVNWLERRTAVAR